MKQSKALFHGAIVLYFIIALEFLIMISPFAGLFYSVFNPLLVAAGRYPATRWLSAFFLPHMVVPPDALLQLIRILGSVLFIVGMVVFLGCAVQVYAHKLLKKGAALKGLYAVLRHPQYLGLGMAGLGLSILWPRFLVLVLWLVMMLLYYLLATDEERRMLKAYPDTYAPYMEKTGMFLPKRIEQIVMTRRVWGKTASFALICALVLGGAFALRAYTVAHLPVWTDGNVVALALNPDDVLMMDHRLPDILLLPEVRARVKDGQRYLVYFLPTDYIMQGLIADTGGEWRLYKQHHTAQMVTDWILHPFGHLTEGGHAMHSASSSAMASGEERRLVFVAISGAPDQQPLDVFAIRAERSPQFMLDVDVHTLTIRDVKDLSKDTAWADVPTPVF
ncbi:MAG: methyltransferase [Candidatus Methylomirabilota bacterium]|jgi:protein-S-isoprenylcysteine O-methyltransferase Ste14